MKTICENEVEPVLDLVRKNVLKRIDDSGFFDGDRRIETILKGVWDPLHLNIYRQMVLPKIEENYDRNN